MTRRLLFVLVMGLVIGTIFGGPPIAMGEIRQSKLVAVKEAAGPFDLDGTYRLRLLYLENFEDIDRGAIILVGSIEFDSAAGTWTVTGGKFFSDGSSEPDAGTGTYTVDPDGSVAFIGGDHDLTWHGDVSIDSKTFIMTLGDTDAGGDILIAIATAVKDEGKLFTVADLDGTYRFRTLELHRFEDADTDAVVSIATIECDGQGNWTATYTYFESDGSSESGTTDGTYSVNAENSFEFAETGVSGVDFSADSSSDGNILILTKGKVKQPGGIAQWIGTAIKEDPTKTFTDADLNGKYRGQWLTLLDYESNDEEAEACYGTITSDGTGSWTVTGSCFDSDDEIDPAIASGTYQVNPDGSFEFTVTSVSPNETWTGDISSDGELITMTQSQAITGDWVGISGDITTQDGTPVCAMALANGQYMFTSDPTGKYDLSVPLDENGQITLFSFVDGFAPFKYIFTPEGTSENIDIMMLPAPPNSRQMTLTCQFDDTAENPGWAKISGQARAENGGAPLCAMVLANGQYMFSSAGNGEYELEVPLDENGQVTLFGFADGFQPYKEVLDR